MRRSFLKRVEEFSHYKMGVLSFKYLELPVGVNSKKVETWDHIVKIISKILASWRNHFCSLYGRFVLLNLMLNFTRSFSYYL